MTRPPQAHVDTDATLPPLSALDGLICPVCRKGSDAPASGGRVARCPEHGLALVSAKEIRESGEDPMLGRTFAGRFVVLSKLGSGAMGAVYRARQEAVGRDVALKIVRPDKVYDPDTRARFEREARAMSALTSPHTITAFDFGSAEDGAWYLAMELLDGETLGARLKRGPLSVAETVALAREALESLAEAHTKGIIHRDLKPDNLFLARTTDGRRATCKVLDFGIAKLMRDELQIDQLETQAGTVFGTPRYMSPEQAQGKPLDARGDLYSLGVILYHALAGRAPYVDDDAVVVMARHIKEAPPRLADVAPPGRIPTAVETVVMRALEKSPDARFQSAEEFSTALEAALDDATASGSHSTSWVATPGPSRPRPGAWILGGAIVSLVALAVTVWVWAGSSTAEPAEAALPSQGETLGVAASSAAMSESASASPPLPETASAPTETADSPPLGVPSAAPVTKPKLKPRPVGTSDQVKRKVGDRYGRFE